MSNISDWIKYELYPSLYGSIDRALPEFDFMLKRGNWVSRNKLKVTGEQGDSIGKVCIWERTPGYIKDWTREGLSIIDYVIQRDRVEFIQAVETLARVAGLQIPKSSDFNPEAYGRFRDGEAILEACNDYFIWCLENAKGAEDVRAYLSSRGYSEEDVKAMELGYIPSQSKLYTYLLDPKKGYSQGLVEEAVRLKEDTRIGSTHRLTIPYRSGGYIRGFKFRTIGTDEPKYINSQGLDRAGGFFNLTGIKGDKDLLIVEGELDALRASVKGLDNVVAIGGSSISPEQIRDAKRRGARKFTLCLDNEPGAEKKTLQAIDKILPEDSRIYIATLPELGEGKTDPDKLIKEAGVEALAKARDEALPWYEYKLQAILSKYAQIGAERDLTPKELDNLQDEVVETSQEITDPMSRDRYKRLFTDLDDIKELGITLESLTITTERLSSTREKEKQTKQLRELLSEASRLQDRGDTEEALDLLDKRGRDIKTVTGKGLLPPHLTFTNIMDRIAEAPDPLRTGYPSLDSFIGFPPGSISLVAGRTGHGKTTLLYNFLLEMSRVKPDKSFYFFTYEEPVANIYVKLLNRLTATDLSKYYENIYKHTNYEFIKAYIKAGRTDIRELEEGKRQLRSLVDTGRIKIVDRNYSVEELYRLILYLRERETIGAVIIDYIQRMRTERRTQDKRTEVAHISDQVLQIAKETGLPIILGAQLNREMTKGASKKPYLEHLKEAGNLEEDANTVISIYNESREKEEDEEGNKYKGQREVDLELKALKNREGEVNRTALLTFDKWTGVIKEKEGGSHF